MNPRHFIASGEAAFEWRKLIATFFTNELTHYLGRPERPKPERSARAAALRGGDLMRRGHAKPGHAARQETAADRHWSARAELARVSREAPYFIYRAKAQLSRGLKRQRAASRGVRGTSVPRPARARPAAAPPRRRGRA